MTRLAAGATRRSAIPRMTAPDTPIEQEATENETDDGERFEHGDGRHDAEQHIGGPESGSHTFALAIVAMWCQIVERYPVSSWAH